MSINRFLLESTAFEDNAEIPSMHTCEGANTAPTLIWKNAPKDTKSFALLCEDPDAPTREPWVHWLVANIPHAKMSIDSSLKHRAEFPDGMRQGITTAQTIGYDDPCPPAGERHRYIFTVYALDANLTLQPGFTKKQLLAEFEGHIIEQTSLTGTYQLVHRHER